MHPSLSLRVVLGKASIAPPEGLACVVVPESIWPLIDYVPEPKPRWLGLGKIGPHDELEFNANGKALARGLPPGDYRIKVWPENVRIEPERLHLSGDEPETTRLARLDTSRRGAEPPAPGLRRRLRLLPRLDPPLAAHARRARGAPPLPGSRPGNRSGAPRGAAVRAPARDPLLRRGWRALPRRRGRAARPGQRAQQALDAAGLPARAARGARPRSCSTRPWRATAAPFRACRAC